MRLSLRLGDYVMLARTFVSYIFFFLIADPIGAQEHFVYTACYTDVQLRETPSPTGRKIGILPKGQKVRASESDRYWVKIVWRDDNSEWHVGWAASTTLCPGD
ncbi:MAG: SH3 domain-containing protein [Thermodesulfobacteriota bacterium]